MVTRERRMVYKGNRAVNVVPVAAVEVTDSVPL
jgi:hypothetical protein